MSIILDLRLIFPVLFYLKFSLATVQKSQQELLCQKKNSRTTQFVTLIMKYGKPIELRL